MERGAASACSNELRQYLSQVGRRGSGGTRALPEYRVSQEWAGSWDIVNELGRRLGQSHNGRYQGGSKVTRSVSLGSWRVQTIGNSRRVKLPTPTASRWTPSPDIGIGSATGSVRTSNGVDRRRPRTQESGNPSGSRHADMRLISIEALSRSSGSREHGRNRHWRDRSV